MLYFVVAVAIETCFTINSVTYSNVKEVPEYDLTVEHVLHNGSERKLQSTIAVTSVLFEMYLNIHVSIQNVQGCDLNLFLLQLEMLLQSQCL